MSATLTNTLEATLAFFRDALNGVAVLPATGEGLPAQGELGDTLVVDLAGGPGEIIPFAPQRVGLVLYGPDPLDVYYRVLGAARQAPHGLPHGPRLIAGRWWLRRFELGQPVGPQAEPETRRQRVDASAVLTWGLYEAT